jgi:curved DNA-binding protein CbpA
MDEFKDLYDVLGVAPTAAPEVIRAAYRVLALRHHPDRHANRTVDGAAMARLNKAYDVLSCPERRRAYDQWRHSRHADQHPLEPVRCSVPMVLTTYDRRGRLHAYT